ncbi:MAG: hypothetical protein J6T99_06220 [Oscillospiraceae bacterium]|nr:hypothetical protein [Oscillospiraceae bacterium]
MRKSDFAMLIVLLLMVAIGIVIYIFIKLNGLSDPAPILKDDPEPTKDPQTAYLYMVEAPKAEPVIQEAEPLIYIPDQIIHHELDQHDVKILARLLWSSPLRDETEKRRLLWVVFNRMDDDSGIFGNTVSSVVIKSEFRFYDPKSYISKENQRIVEEELNKYLSMWDGLYINRLIPANHIYCDFESYTVHTYRSISRAS